MGQSTQEGLASAVGKQSWTAQLQTWLANHNNKNRRNPRFPQYSTASRTILVICKNTKYLTSTVKCTMPISHQSLPDMQKLRKTWPIMKPIDQPKPTQNGHVCENRQKRTLNRCSQSQVNRENTQETQICLLEIKTTMSKVKNMWIAWSDGWRKKISELESIEIEPIPKETHREKRTFKK